MTSSPSPRILVAGTGALGSVFGGFLRRAGYDVTLLGRAEHIGAIGKAGLAVEGIWGEHRIDGFKIAESPDELNRPGSPDRPRRIFDLILVTVKSYDTRAVAQWIAPLLAPEGVAISLQNGLGNVEALESVVGPERTLGARVIFGAVVPAPGRVRVTVIADPNALGALQPGLFPRRDQLARWWSAAIDAAGVPTSYTEDLPAKLWAKVFYNAALNPLGALLGLHYGALPEREDGRAVMDRVIDEAFAVARAEGVPLAWPDANAYRSEFYARLVPATYDHRSSMLQDIERGRRTEVDAINGEVWRRGKTRGIATPSNEMLTRLIRLRSAVS